MSPATNIFPATVTPIKLISTITAVLVAILAGLAFILSYNALQHMAAQNGVEGWLSYLWPLLLDFAMIVFSLAILRANLRQESAWYPWVLTLIFASLATLANVMDVTRLGLPPLIVAAAVKALAPVALVLAFELLMSMTKAEIKRQALTASLADLRARRQALIAAIDKLGSQHNRLATELADLKSERGQSYAGIGDATRVAALEILRNAPEISGAELARQLERSPSTGRRLRRELLPLLSANGH